MVEVQKTLSTYAYGQESNDKQGEEFHGDCTFFVSKEFEWTHAAHEWNAHIYTKFAIVNHLWL